MVTQVDDADYERLSKYKWYGLYTKTGYYAVRFEYIGKKQKGILMHREILNLVNAKLQGDHRDLNKLNNQRYNLRIVTNSQNLTNKKTYSKTGYKGVYKKGNIYRVSFKIDVKMEYFGNYKTAKEAALRADEVMRKIHGVNGRYNFPRKGERSCRN